MGAPSTSMASSSSSSIQLDDIVNNLKHAHSSNQPQDIWKHDLLKAKLQLAQTGLLIPSSSPSPSSSSSSSLESARQILELGALLSLKAKDVEAFHRYLDQVKAFWDPSLGLKPSSLEAPLTGASLLARLAQNDIAGFHTLLEELAAKSTLEELQANVYTKYPLDLERWLMEGAYSKVWSTRSSSPLPEYSIFLDQLVQTVRNEIASCSEKAYTSLPLSNAAVLLFFQNRQDLLDFANNRKGWKINPSSQVIEFSGTIANDELARQELPKERLVETILGYAKELETIV